LDTTEILDLETPMRFSAGPRMLSESFLCTAVALDARRVLVAGGRDNHGRHMTTEILDVATMTFRAGPEMLSGRTGCSAVALLEGNPRRVLVVGGRDGDYNNVSTTEVLDLGTMAFSRGPTMRTARYGCAAVLMGGGGDSRRRCLVVGGYDEDESEVSATEVFDLETMEFTGHGPAMLAGRGGCAAVADHDAGGENRVLVLGGRSSSTGMEVLEEAAAAAQEDNTRVSTRRRRR
jgi:hypothetical protein